MRNGRTFICLAVACAALAFQPAVARAFELVELAIDVNLAVGEAVGISYAFAGLPNTGVEIRNAESSPIDVDGSTTFDGFADLPGNHHVQGGFVLLDGTLELEATAVDSQGGRADVRITYLRDVRADFLRVRYLRDALVRQGVVTDPVRARARARAMTLADARVMRFVRARADGDGRWVRAVRALSDIRRSFRPRMEPDGVLGHYGTAISQDGDPYVWAVLDRNSEYAIGVTVDRDGDGAPNSNDNCIGTANPNQLDSDSDGFGDLCDADDDNDGIGDILDNCPLVDNPGQIDGDQDGIGDACDADDDNDGVIDGNDSCTGTAPGAIVDATGCSIDDLCPCDNDWRNHGMYVRCVAHAARDFVRAGLITGAEKDAIVSSAASSSCGF